MATQTINTFGITGRTYTAKLYSFGSDTLIQAASSTVESTNRKTNYVGTFTDVPAGTYLIQLENASGISESNYWVTIVDSSTAFQAYELPVPIDANVTQWSVSGVSLPAIASDDDVDPLQAVRGDYWSLSISGLGDISDRTKLYFGIKASADIDDDDDTDCLVQIEETAGLLYIQKEAATTATNGSITVTDASLGNITINLRGVESAKLISEDILYWEVQKHYTVGADDEPKTMKTKYPFELVRDVNRTVT